MASRISKSGWLVLYVVTGGIDFVQLVIIELVLVWFFGIGIGVNEVLDPIVGVALGAQFQLRGVSLFKYPSRFLSMVGVEIAEEGSLGVAQIWIAEVWYMHRSVKKEEALIAAAKVQRELLNQMTSSQNQNGRREPARIQPRNSSGRHEPLVVK